MLTTAIAPPVEAAPEGQISFAVHVTLAPKWLDPAETESAITPFMMLYAIHDALVKPMPGGLNTPSLAESWTASKDGVTYEFLLRNGIKFHNGDPVTAEDVKFSFERYRGGGAKLFKERVKEVRVVDARRVRFVMKEPWPDFMTFYGTTATGAGWVVPKKYVEKVGDEGFLKAPIGAGPYKYVSQNQGIDLTLEAFEGYWRKVPSVKRLVLKSVPDETTRAAALKRGEVDIAYFLNGPDRRGRAQDAGPQAHGRADQYHLLPRLRRAVGAEVPLARPARPPRREPRHRPEGHQRRRVARLLGADRQYRAPAHGVRPAHRAASLRSQAGQAAPRRRRLCERIRRGRPHAEPAVLRDGGSDHQLPRGGGNQDPRSAAWSAPPSSRPTGEKKLKGVVMAPQGTAGNAATRVETMATKNGLYAYGVLPEVEDLFQRQAEELDRKKREELLHQAQKILHDKVVFAPIWENGFIRGVGAPRGGAGLSLIPAFPYSAPLEDLRLKK